MENIALWMSQPHHGYRDRPDAGREVADPELEHGTFDLSTLDQFLAFTRPWTCRS